MQQNLLRTGMLVCLIPPIWLRITLFIRLIVRISNYLAVLKPQHCNFGLYTKYDE